MANPEHLDILSQGVEVWNEWRQSHPDVKPDLTSIKWFYDPYQDLPHVSLQHQYLTPSYIVDLTGINFTNASLSGLELSTRFEG